MDDDLPAKHKRGDKVRWPACTLITLLCSPGPLRGGVPLMVQGLGSEGRYLLSGHAGQAAAQGATRCRGGGSRGTATCLPSTSQAQNETAGLCVSLSWLMGTMHAGVSLS